MAKRIFGCRCEDCYELRDLHVYEVDFMGNRVDAELCQVCINQRKALAQNGKEQPPIGLLMEGEWIQINSITVVFQDSRRIVVDIKYLSNTKYAGIVRIKFPEEIKWLAGGVFGTSSHRAISEAEHHLRHSYFPNESIKFE